MISEDITGRTMAKLRIVVLGGSLSPVSRVDRLAQWCARVCAEARAEVTCFRGVDLEFPFYRPGMLDRAARDYLDAVRAADGVVLVSPAYHGTVSGLLKNALDYVNELAGEDAPFLDDRPIGCVAVAAGEQGAHSTLATLRTIAHALRGWPTPLGLALAADRAGVGRDGVPTDARTCSTLSLMLDQVLTAAARQARDRRPVRLS
ncbi:NAD(P)H-dependent oxidoreductase [Micromonospora ureilytica]|uniref:NADPH-dependent FMN reductase n=1 Tax=Micromonospora ureilytica TaxID=709868 RepID=UPI0033FD62E3